LLLDENFVSQVIAGVRGTQLPRVSFEYLQNLDLPCPELVVQKNIVEQVEAQRVMVESARGLIGIYQNKTEELIASLWS
jgi:type I restriction enzyme M protein